MSLLQKHTHLVVRAGTRGFPMQVISRGVDESLMIGDMMVTVLEVQTTHVRLGINAPDSIPSYWEETLYLDSHEDLDDAEEVCEALVAW